MKKTFLIVVCLLLSTTLMSQINNPRLNNLISLMENTESCTVIKISKPMFKFIEKLDVGYPIQKLADKIESFTVITANLEDNKDPHISSYIKDINLVISRLLNYEELITIKDKDTTVKMIAEKSKDDSVKNFIMTVKSDKEFMLMVLNGNFIDEDFNDWLNNPFK